MIAEDIITQWRYAIDDAIVPYQITDVEAMFFLNSAIDEACIRADLLFDKTSSDICNISILAGTATYDLDPRIIRIKRATLVSNGLPLRRFFESLLDDWNQNWETETGDIEGYLDEDTSITFVRIPTVNDTVKLGVYRTQLYEIEDLSDEPEIKSVYHKDLIDWMANLAFLKEDTEIFDPTAAAKAEARFEKKFGPRPSAVTMKNRRLIDINTKIQGREFGT